MAQTTRNGEWLEVIKQTRAECEIVHYKQNRTVPTVTKEAVKLLPLPKPQLRAHGRTDKFKRPESHPTKECTRACVICIMTEPKYYYCPITLVMT
jgi:hypothetical protein